MSLLTGTVSIGPIKGGSVGASVVAFSISVVTVTSMGSSSCRSSYNIDIRYGNFIS
jgi:hypothetical protein